MKKGILQTYSAYVTYNTYENSGAANPLLNSSFEILVNSVN